jgi:hypothetical protein
LSFDRGRRNRVSALYMDTSVILISMFPLLLQQLLWYPPTQLMSLHHMWGRSGWSTVHSLWSQGISSHPRVCYFRVDWNETGGSNCTAPCALKAFAAVLAGIVSLAAQGGREDWANQWSPHEESKSQMVGQNQNQNQSRAQRPWLKNQKSTK